MGNIGLKDEEWRETVWRSGVRARGEHGEPVARSKPGSYQVGKGEGLPGLALRTQVGAIEGRLGA